MNATKASMLKKKKVLIVEDEPDAIARLYLGLIRYDYNVEVSDRPEELMARLNRFKPQILLIKDALQDSTLCRNIKEKFGIPILVITDGQDLHPGFDVDDSVKGALNISQIREKIEVLIEKYNPAEDA
jgi:DNA-binding response OmpR family regulator